MKTVLLVGSGGREHALAWKLAQSPEIGRKIAAPGNDGFSPDWERWSLDLTLTGELARSEFERLALRAKEVGVSLAVIGPDHPLAEGIVDIFEAQGIPAFGPSKRAARLEASKGFAKEVMAAAGVPTAKYFRSTLAAEAQKILKSVPWPKDGGWVVKADGLALGKGVRVCMSYDEASKAAAELIAVSGSLVIEEKLRGQELSWLAICDGERCALFEPVRDHKALLDGNQGPNTGGMGAFSPVPGVPQSWEKRVREEVFLPVLREMKARGMPFRGILYAGLMCDFKADRFWVLEFNARFGDPETQVLLARLNGDLLDWLWASAHGDLGRLPEKVPFSSDAAVIVIATARGYPECPEKGHRIEGLSHSAVSAGTGTGMGACPEFFIAGAQRGAHGEYVTSGGRVLGAMGVGDSLSSACRQAYQRLARVEFQGMHFRVDIGEEQG